MYTFLACVTRAVSSEPHGVSQYRARHIQSEMFSPSQHVTQSPNSWETEDRRQKDAKLYPLCVFAEIKELLSITTIRNKNTTKTQTPAQFCLSTVLMEFVLSVAVYPKVTHQLHIFLSTKYAYTSCLHFHFLRLSINLSSKSKQIKTT